MEQIRVDFRSCDTQGVFEFAQSEAVQIQAGDQFLGVDSSGSKAVFFVSGIREGIIHALATWSTWSAGEGAQDQQAPIPEVARPIKF